MPKSMQGLVGLLPTEDDQVPIETTDMCSIHSIEDRETGDESSKVLKPAKETCLACGHYWKGWCAAQAPRFYSISCFAHCPPGALELGPPLEEQDRQEPRRLCRDCLVRSQCSRFIGNAWWYPDCSDFRKNN